MYELTGKAACDVVDMKGEKFLSAAAEKEGDKVTVRLNGKTEGLSLLLHHVQAVGSVNGAAAEKAEQGVLLRVNEGADTVSFHI